MGGIQGWMNLGWEESRFGGIPAGGNPSWEETPGWEESFGLGEFCMGGIPKEPIQDCPYMFRNSPPDPVSGLCASLLYHLSALQLQICRFSTIIVCYVRKIENIYFKLLFFSLS